MRTLPVLSLVALACTASTSSAQVASALLHEGDPLPGAPGNTVTSLNNTAANRAGGYAVTVNTTNGVTTLSHCWGHATGGTGTVLVSESTGVAGYDQTSFETFFGMDDLGHCGYSPLTNSLTGGTFGSMSERAAVVTARACSFPALTYSIEVGRLSNMT